MTTKNPAWTQKASDGPYKILGHPGTQLGTWRDPADVTEEHLQCTHFSRFFAVFAIFRPLWYHTKASEEPKFLVKVPLEFQEGYGELYRSGTKAPTSRSGSFEMSHLLGP